MSNDNTPNVPFPWSAYLSQPIFHRKHKLILNPQLFRQRYQVRLLESCLHKRFPSAKYRNNLSGF